MGKFKDLTGQRFGRLTVIERAEKSRSGTRWKCTCDCGNEVVVFSGNLIREYTLSCGCLKKEITKKRSIAHGMSHTHINNVWKDIKRRCTNPTRPEYCRYGGRGITIYPDWIDDFQAFYDYVSRLPHFGEEGYTLDRIDNNGNYEPNNLRWADRKTQSRNTRRNIIVEYNGEKMSLAEAAEMSGIAYYVLHNRIKRGDRGDRLFRPVTK